MTTSQDITIEVDHTALAGTLAFPASPVGLVVFAHGSGNERVRTSSTRVAEALHRARIATLLLDLVNPGEELDLQALAARLTAAIDRIIGAGLHRGLPLGLFGSGLGATAALITAAQRIDAVSAVVCRGGRPDLAGTWLSVLRTPTLLIAGSRDTSVLTSNRDAARAMVAPHKVFAIPGATHLFEEPGALDEVAAAASAWFTKYSLDTASANLVGGA